MTAPELGWAAFAAAAPELSAAGRRRLVQPDGIAIGFLATASERGTLRLAPVCPIFCGDHLYLSAGAHTPKAADLRTHGPYVLHAFLGANDEEFQIAGHAALVGDEAERAAVHDAIPFGAFSRTDPIYRFGIARALHVYWENVGKPDTRPIRRRWPER
jgi:hypothetical protein